MTTLLINVSVCVRGRVFPSIFFRCYVYLPLSLSFFLSLSLSLSLYTHIYTSFMIFSTDDIAKYHEYINSQGNDKTIHIKHIHKTYPYPQNIPAFFFVKLFLASTPGASCLLLGLDGGTVIDEGAAFRGFSSKLWDFGSEKHHEMVHGDTRILIQLMYLESRHVTRGRRLEICQEKSEIWMCFFATGTVYQGDFTRFQQISPLMCDHHKDSFGAVKWTFHQKDHGIGHIGHRYGA